MHRTLWLEEPGVTMRVEQGEVRLAGKSAPVGRRAPRAVRRLGAGCCHGELDAQVELGPRQGRGRRQRARSASSGELARVVAMDARVVDESASRLRELRDEERNGFVSRACACAVARRNVASPRARAAAVHRRPRGRRAWRARGVAPLGHRGQPRRGARRVRDLRDPGARRARSDDGAAARPGPALRTGSGSRCRTGSGLRQRSWRLSRRSSRTIGSCSSRCARSPAVDF